MRYYEIMVILNGELQKEEAEKIVEEFKNLIEENNGKIFKIDEMGLRKFAYPIKKKMNGYYYVFYVKLDYELLKEIERRFKLNENVFRYLVIRHDPKKLEVFKEEAAWF